jgi:hypothetical protein
MGYANSLPSGMYRICYTATAVGALRQRLNRVILQWLRQSLYDN